MKDNRLKSEVQATISEYHTTIPFSLVHTIRSTSNNIRVSHYNTFQLSSSNQKHKQQYQSIILQYLSAQFIQSEVQATISEYQLQYLSAQFIQSEVQATRSEYHTTIPFSLVHPIRSTSNKIRVSHYNTFQLSSYNQKHKQQDQSIKLQYLSAQFIQSEAQATRSEYHTTIPFSLVHTIRSTSNKIRVSHYNTFQLSSSNQKHKQQYQSITLQYLSAQFIQSEVQATRSEYQTAIPLSLLIQLEVQATRSNGFKDSILNTRYKRQETKQISRLKPWIQIHFMVQLSILVCHMSKDHHRQVSLISTFIVRETSKIQYNEQHINTDIYIYIYTNRHK